MTLIKWTPNRNIFNIFDDFDYLFQRSFGLSDIIENKSITYTPKMNFYETEKAYQVSLDIPGVNKKDIEVSYNNGLLTVSGDRKLNDKAENDNFVCNEIIKGSFSRSFNLPLEIIENKIKAKFNNGVLNIEIPKAKEITPPIKKIEIN